MKLKDRRFFLDRSRIKERKIIECKIDINNNSEH